MLELLTILTIAVMAVLAFGFMTVMYCGYALIKEIMDRSDRHET